MCLVLAFTILRDIVKQQGKSVGPILTLSYKNHALDEFLLDVLKQDPRLKSGASLVRLGKPDNAELERHTEKYSNKETAAQKELDRRIKVMKDIKIVHLTWLRSVSISGEITGDVLHQVMDFAGLAYAEKFSFVSGCESFEILETLLSCKDGDKVDDKQIKEESEHWPEAGRQRSRMTFWIKGQSPPKRCCSMVRLKKKANESIVARCRQYASSYSSFCGELHACQTQGCQEERKVGKLYCVAHACRGNNGTCDQNVVPQGSFCLAHSCLLCDMNTEKNGPFACTQHQCRVDGCQQAILFPLPFCENHCCHQCMEDQTITADSEVFRETLDGVVNAYNLCNQHKCAFSGCGAEKDREAGGRFCSYHHCFFCTSIVDERCPSSGLCAQHRCAYEDEDDDELCANFKVVLRDGRESTFCHQHLCLGCVRTAGHDLNQRTSAPWYNCEKHVFCQEIEASGERCQRLVAENGADQCLWHKEVQETAFSTGTCCGRAAKGKPCKAKAPNGETNRWFCPAHVAQRNEKRVKVSDVPSMQSLQEDEYEVLSIQPEIDSVLSSKTRGNQLVYSCSVQCKGGDQHPCTLLGLVFKQNEQWSCPLHKSLANGSRERLEQQNNGNSSATMGPQSVEDVEDPSIVLPTPPPSESLLRNTISRPPGPKGMFSSDCSCSILL